MRGSEREEKSVCIAYLNTSRDVLIIKFMYSTVNPASRNLNFTYVLHNYYQLYQICIHQLDAWLKKWILPIILLSKINNISHMTFHNNFTSSQLSLIAVL